MTKGTTRKQRVAAKIEADKRACNYDQPAPSAAVVSIEPAAPARRDNRGGRHAGNQGGRPSNASRGLESRNRKVMLKFTASEHATLEALAPDDVDFSVWLRDILLDRANY